MPNHPFLSNLSSFEAFYFILFFYLPINCGKITFKIKNKHEKKDPLTTQLVCLAHYNQNQITSLNFII